MVWVVTLADLPHWLPWAVAIGFGAIWGSFLNVVIYRVPRGMSVVSPGSACPACGASIRAYDNIPIFSYLILRGKARCCGARMSPRYPMVELLGAALSAGVYAFIVLPDHASAPLPKVAFIYLLYFALVLALLAAAFIDLDHMYLPDAVTIGGAIAGLVTFSVRGMDLSDGLFGAACGYFGVYVPFILLYRALRGRPGMGLGDAKLMALVGAWTGWQGVVFALFAGAIQGTVVAMVVLLVAGKVERPAGVEQEIAQLKKAAEEGDEEAQQALEEDPLAQDDGVPAIAFGPFLILAFYEYLAFGDVVIDALGFGAFPID